MSYDLAGACIRYAALLEPGEELFASAGAGAAALDPQQSEAVCAAPPPPVGGAAEAYVLAVSRRARGALADWTRAVWLGNLAEALVAESLGSLDRLGSFWRAVAGCGDEADMAAAAGRAG